MNENKSAFVLIAVIIILLIILFSMVQGIFGANAKSYSDLILPTTAPVETCFNHGFVEKDGCIKIYLPLIER